MHNNARKIIHIDMDAFYASVEQRDDPYLKGKPVVVGGRPDSRGVVAAASYEARSFGIHSAMSCAQAYRRCPDAIFIYPRIETYRRISRVIMAILRDYTDLIEPLSLDEAFMDVTRNKKGIRFATQIAAEARQKILSYTGLTASAGVAPNKFLAKIASDINKPNGMKVIRPEKVEDFLLPLPVRKIPGVGRVTCDKMQLLGIHTIADLRMRTESELVELFGKTGNWYYRIARGLDDRPVVPHRERKSVGAEDTFADDTRDLAFIKEKIEEHAQRVSGTLQKKGVIGRTISLKIKYADFEVITRSRTLPNPGCDTKTISITALSLLEATEAGQRPVRLVGVSVSNLLDHSDEVPDASLNRQLRLKF